MPFGIWPLTRNPRAWAVFTNPGDQFRFKRAIDLDLNISKIGIAVDRGLRFFGRIGIQTGGRLEWAVPIDKSGLPDPRADCDAAVPLVLEVLEFLDVVAHIANAGHAARDVQEPVHSLGVSMHVEETGQQRLAGSIDVLSIFRTCDSGRWTDRRDAFAVDDDRLVFPNGGLLGIKQAHMLHRNRMIQVLGQFCARRALRASSAARSRA